MLRRRDLLTGALTVALAGIGCKSGADGDDDSIGPTMSPAALSGRLADVASGKIAVLYVGPDELFARGHVPGAKNIGAVSSSVGKKALDRALAETPPGTEIVVYCGCCPVRNCPNVRPASRAIRASGRKNAHVLDLPTRFSTDWSDKGFEVERS